MLLGGTSAALPALHVTLLRDVSLCCGGRSPEGVDGMHDALRRDRVGCIPLQRWDAEAAASGLPGSGRPGDPHSSGARFGAYMEGVDLYDPGLFGSSRAEAVAMDPQQRLSLHVACDLLRTARRGAVTAAPRRGAPDGSPVRRRIRQGADGDALTGVWMGASYAEYATISTHVNGATTYTASGGNLSVIPGRVSYVWGLTGPSVLVDTACSSSLVAIAAAQTALQVCGPCPVMCMVAAEMRAAGFRAHVIDQGGGMRATHHLSIACTRCDQTGAAARGLAGGVNLMLAPRTGAMYQAAGEGIRLEGVTAFESNALRCERVGCPAAEHAQWRVSSNPRCHQIWCPLTMPCPPSLAPCHTPSQGCSPHVAAV